MTEPNTDYDDLVALRKKYKDLEASVARNKQNPIDDITVVNEAPVSLPSEAKKDTLSNRLPKVKKLNTKTSEHNLTAEEIIEIEQTKLGVWIAKVLVIFIISVTLFCLLVFTYIAYHTKTLPDIGVIASIFSNIKDIVFVIFDSGGK